MTIYIYILAFNANAFLTMGATETTSLGSVTRDIAIRSTTSALAIAFFVSAGSIDGS